MTLRVPDGVASVLLEHCGIDGIPPVSGFGPEVVVELGMVLEHAVLARGAQETLDGREVAGPVEKAEKSDK